MELILTLIWPLLQFWPNSWEHKAEGLQYVYK